MGVRALDSQHVQTRAKRGDHRVDGGIAEHRSKEILGGDRGFELGDPFVRGCQFSCSVLNSRGSSLGVGASNSKWKIDQPGSSLPTAVKEGVTWATARAGLAR